MSKLIELVEEYGILRYRLACIGERNHASLAARADERKAEIRAKVQELEREAARYKRLRRGICPQADLPGILGFRGEYNPLLDLEIDAEIDKAVDAAMEAANVPER